MKLISPSRKIALRSFLIIIVMIFFIETVIMSSFHLIFLIDNIWLEVFTDAAMLVLFLIPSLYYFMLLPMEREIATRQQTEKALQEANDQAELRVKLRTASPHQQGPCICTALRATTWNRF